MSRIKVNRSRKCATKGCQNVENTVAYALWYRDHRKERIMEVRFYCPEHESEGMMFMSQQKHV